MPTRHKITAFAPTASGARRRAFNLEGFEVHVEPASDQDEQQAAFTERLADAFDRLAAERFARSRLEEHIRHLEAKLPPPEPRCVFGPGYVRTTTNGEMWLLGNREKGFGHFGVRVDGWDDLFRRYKVRVVEVAADEHGPYVKVE